MNEILTFVNHAHSWPMWIDLHENIGSDPVDANRAPN